MPLGYALDTLRKKGKASPQSGYCERPQRSLRIPAKNRDRHYYRDDS